MCSIKGNTYLLFSPVAENQYWYGDFKLLESPCHLPTDIPEQTSLESEYEQIMARIREASCMFIDGNMKGQEDTCSMGPLLHQVRTEPGEQARTIIPSPCHPSEKKKLSSQWTHSGSPEGGWLTGKAMRVGVSSPVFWCQIPKYHSCDLGHLVISEP